MVVDVLKGIGNLLWRIALPVPALDDMVDCAVAGRKPLVCRTVFCGYTRHLHKPSILQEPQFPDTGGIHLGGMTLDRFLINAASPLGKQLRPVIVQGALMAAGSLVGKDGFPTIAHTLRKYFPKSYTPARMQETIIKLLEAWQRKRQRDQER